MPGEPRSLTIQVDQASSDVVPPPATPALRREDVAPPATLEPAEESEGLAE